MKNDYSVQEYTKKIMGMTKNSWVSGRGASAWHSPLSHIEIPLQPFKTSMTAIARLSSFFGMPNPSTERERERE